jgi:hypothetical protein
VRHRLVADARTDSVEDITAGLVALHSTDPVTVYLSAAARMVHPKSGPLTAREIGARLPALTVPIVIGGGKFAVTQPAHSRVLLQMGFEGHILRARPTGTWINGQYRYAAVDEWFPGGFGELDEGTGYVLPDDVDAPAPAPPSAALLPGLDPSTMGVEAARLPSRPADVPLLFDRNGNGGPTAWVDGRIVGGRHHRADGTVALHLTRDVGDEACRALRERARMIERLLGDVRFTVRFPSPVLAALAETPPGE